MIESDLDDTDGTLAAVIGLASVARLRESVALLQEVGTPFDVEQFLAGSLTSVFFGSAISNFGVEALLEAIAEFAPPPGSHESSRGSIEPNDEPFSGFVFKI